MTDSVEDIEDIKKEIEKLKNKLNEFIEKFNAHTHNIVSEDLTDTPNETMRETV